LGRDSTQSLHKNRVQNHELVRQKGTMVKKKKNRVCIQRVEWPTLLVIHATVKDSDPNRLKRGLNVDCSLHRKPVFRRGEGRE